MSGDGQKTAPHYTQGSCEMSIICMNKSFFFNVLLAILERSHSVVVTFVLL